MSKRASTIEIASVVLIIIAILVSGVSVAYVSSLNSKMSELSSAIPTISSKIDDLSTKLEKLTTAESDLANAMKDLTTAFGKSAADIKAIQDRLAKLENATIPIQPTKKVTLRIGVLKTFETMDPPQWGDDTLNAIGQHVWEALFRMAWNRSEIIYEPILCESYQQTDNLTWVFNIRRGVKFSDGSGLDAWDVYWSLARTDPRPPNMIWSLDERIQSYEVLNNYTIKMVTKYPMNNLQAWLCQGWTNIVSYDWIKKTGQEHTYPLNGIPPGTGQYMWYEFEPMVYAKMNLNPYWRGTPPQITNIEVYAAYDDTARVTALQAGSLDWITQVPPEAVKTLKDAGYTIWKYNLPQLTSIAPNNVFPPCDILKVRQAMAYAINYNELISTLYGETANRPFSMALPGTIGYTEIHMYDYDPVKARQLLSEAGYSSGLTLKMAVVEAWAMPKSLEATAAIQKYFKDVGINLEIEVLERAAYRAMTSGIREKYLAGEHVDFRWHLVLRPWGTDTMYAGDDMLSLYLSTVSANSWYYNNTKVDQLIKFAVSMAPLDERIKALHEAQQIMMEDCAGIPIYSGASFAASAPQLKGFVFQPNGYEYFVESTLIK